MSKQGTGPETKAKAKMSECQGKEIAVEKLMISGRVASKDREIREKRNGEKANETDVKQLLNSQSSQRLHDRDTQKSQ